MYRSSIDKNEMKTLSDVMNKLKEEGFKHEFVINDNGLTSEGSPFYYVPEQVRVIDFYRFEGESDPADSSILYALENSDGEKGVLSDSYGPYGDEKISSFIRQVEEIQKQRGMAPQPDQDKLKEA